MATRLDLIIVIELPFAAVCFFFFLHIEVVKVSLSIKFLPLVSGRPGQILWAKALD